MACRITGGRPAGGSSRVDGGRGDQSLGKGQGVELSEAPMSFTPPPPGLSGAGKPRAEAGQVRIEGGELRGKPVRSMGGARRCRPGVVPRNQTIPSARFAPDGGGSSESVIGTGLIRLSWRRRSPLQTLSLRLAQGKQRAVRFPWVRSAWEFGSARRVGFILPLPGSDGPPPPCRRDPVAASNQRGGRGRQRTGVDQAPSPALFLPRI